MKNLKKVMGSIAIFIIAFVIMAAIPANATVGGETLVSDYKYNPADESVYYTLKSDSGRGCPPELLKISLKTGSTSKVVSCEKSIALFDDKSYNAQNEINKINSNFKDLIPFDIAKENITTSLKFLSTKTFAEFDAVMYINYTATVYQNGKKLNEWPTTGCKEDQPFNFQGYRIPGLNKKIIIKQSAISDCFEGGYISESLHMVSDVEGLVSTVETKQIETPTVNSAVVQPEKINTTLLLILPVLTLIIGIMLGYIMNKKN